MNELLVLIDAGSDGDTPPTVKAMRMALPGMLRRMAAVDENLLSQYCAKFSDDLHWVAYGTNRDNLSEESREGVAGREIGLREIDFGGEINSAIREGLSAESDSSTRHEAPISSNIPNERNVSGSVVPQVGPRRKTGQQHVIAVGTRSGSTTQSSVEARSDSSLSDRQSE